jgi:hypothetical protein
VLASPQQPKTLRNIVIVTSVISIVFVLLSALWFWSIVLTLRPEAVISGWEKSNNEEINQELALKMIARLKHAIVINPLDANSHLLLARYYEVLTKRQPNTKPNQYTELAQQEYKKAIKQQVSWDYAWARLASFYSNQQLLNEIDLMHALSKAMLLGPYERENQKIIIPLIFKHWPLVTKNKKEAIQATKIIKHALKYSPYALFILDTAKKYNQLTILEPLLTNKWHKNRLKKYLREVTND